MTTWSELKRQEKAAIITFIVIVLIIIILAWYGYYTGAWEKQPEGAQNGNGTMFSYQQTGWPSG